MVNFGSGKGIAAAVVLIIVTDRVKPKLQKYCGNEMKDNTLSGK